MFALQEVASLKRDQLKDIGNESRICPE